MMSGMPDVTATPSQSTKQREHGTVAFESIEGSKENLQPLVRGSATKRMKSLAQNLGTNKKELTEKQTAEREEWEKAIENDINHIHNGTNDPLHVWSGYIKWVKNNFANPNNQKAQLLKLLERCTKRFENEEKYRNSKKYLRIWLEYANLCQDALSVFKFIQNKNIGLNYALFWRAWAIVAEQHSMFDLCYQIYGQGKARNALPIEDLNKSYDSFCVRMKRRIDNGQVSNVNTHNSGNINRGNLAPLTQTGASSSYRNGGNNHNNNHLGFGGQRQHNESTSSRRRHLGNSGNMNSNNNSNNSNNSYNAGFAIFSDSQQRQPQQQSVSNEQFRQSQSQQRGWNTLGSDANRRKENCGIAQQWQSQGFGQNINDGIQQQQQGGMTRRDYYAMRYNNVSNADINDSNGFSIHIDEECRDKSRNKKKRSKKQPKWKYTKAMGKRYKDGSQMCISFHDPSLLSFGGEECQFEEVRYYKMRNKWNITYLKIQKEKEKEEEKKSSDDEGVEEEDVDMTMTTNVSKILSAHNLTFDNNGYLMNNRVGTLSPVCEAENEGDTDSQCTSTTTKSKNGARGRTGGTRGSRPLKSCLKKIEKKVTIFETDEQAATSQSEIKKKLRKGTPYHPPPHLRHKLIELEEEEQEDKIEQAKKTRVPLQQQQNNLVEKEKKNENEKQNKNDSNDNSGGGGVVEAEAEAETEEEDIDIGFNGQNGGKTNDVNDVNDVNDENDDEPFTFGNSNSNSNVNDMTETFDIAEDTTMDKGFSFKLMNELHKDGKNNSDNGNNNNNNDNTTNTLQTGTLHSQLTDATPNRRLEFDTPMSSRVNNGKEMGKEYENNNLNDENINPNNDFTTSEIFNGEQTSDFTSFFNKPMKISHKRANDTPTQTMMRRVGQSMPTPTQTICTKAAMKELRGMFNDDPTMTITMGLGMDMGQQQEHTPRTMLTIQNTNANTQIPLDLDDGAPQPQHLNAIKALKQRRQQPQPLGDNDNSNNSNDNNNNNDNTGFGEPMDNTTQSGFDIFQDDPTINTTKNLLDSNGNQDDNTNDHESKDNDEQVTAKKSVNSGVNLIKHDPFEPDFMDMCKQALYQYYQMQDNDKIKCLNDEVIPVSLSDTIDSIVKNGTNIEFEITDEDYFEISQYLTNMSENGFEAFFGDDIGSDNSDETGRIIKINNFGDVKEYHVSHSLKNSNNSKNDKEHMMMLLVNKICLCQSLYLFKNHTCVVMNGCPRVINDLSTVLSYSGAQNDMIDEKLVLFYLSQMCDILSLLHKNNMIHCNVKSNCFILNHINVKHVSSQWEYNKNGWEKCGLMLCQYQNCIGDFVTNSTENENSVHLFEISKQTLNSNSNDNNNNINKKQTVAELFQQCKNEMSNESQVNNCWLFECDYFGVLCILFQLLTKTGNFLQCVKEIGQLMIENSNGSSDVGIGKLIESIKFRFYLTSLLFVFFLLLPCFVLFCFVLFIFCLAQQGLLVVLNL